MTIGADPRINLKHIYVFLSVAEHASFRIAAETLNKSESAVSVQIRQLEDQIGVALFHRTTRQVRLTTEGALLVNAARRSVAELENGLKQLRGAADMARGTVSIACIPTVAVTRLPGALASFRKEHPGIAIRLRELQGEQLLESMRRFEVDFAISLSFDDIPDMDFKPLISDPICCVSHDDFDLPLEVTPSDIAHLPIIMHSNSSRLYQDIVKGFVRYGRTLAPAFEVLRVPTLLALAEAGAGVGILPDIALSVRQLPNLRLSRFSPPLAERTLGLLTNRGQMLPPAAEKLKQNIIKAF